MAVKSIVMLSETNGYDSWQQNSGYDEPYQGTTFDLVRIYKVENTDGSDQYFKFIITLDSYGNAGGNYSGVSDAIPKKFTEVKPVEKTVTVFE